MSTHPSARFDEAQELLLAEVPPLTGFQQRVVTGESAAPPPSDRLVVGSIDFDGSGMSGALTLAAPRAVWESVAPDLGPPPIDGALVCDMVGELCNMVLGRFRNSLLRRGVEVGCATPVATSDVAANLTPPRGVHSSWSVLDGNGGALYLRLDVSFAPDFSFEATDAGAEPVEPNIDDLVLF